MVLPLVLALSLSAADAGVASLTWDERSAVKLVEGQALALTLKKAPSRIAASDPRVCDVVAEKDTVLKLTARRPGTTVIALWYGMGFKGLQVEVASKNPKVTASSDGGVPFFSWDGNKGLRVPLDTDFVVQGPGGLERVAPGSHRRCTMTSIGNDQLRFTCADPGPVSVFLWYANNRERTLELEVLGPDGGSR
ncbi:MAG: pilus assembly protein N-terminal domain-containing protein [Myxococcus sp.]|nr:pilus assembly protein N-terminal domain-containing protein [Myxococcus sp.]